MEKKKNIVLVDDHIIIRDGLRELIEKLGPYSISHQFDNGASLIEALPEISKKADLIILDISMNGMSGDEAMAILHEQKCEIPVLILTLNDDEELVIRMFRLGARGFLQKSCTAAEMKAALGEIFEKGYYHNDFLTYSLRNSQAPPKKDPQQAILLQLSDREKEFLKWTCDEKELTYKEIADRMGVQPRTVDGYRESVFEKFDIRSKTGLVLFVLKHKLYEHL